MADNASEEILIKNSLNGDMLSFQRLVEHYQPYVYSIAFRFLNNKTDSEDIVQECFIRVWKNLNRYKPGYRFSTWIYRIVTNLCLDQYRRKNRSKTGNYEDLQGIENIPATDQTDTESIIINMEMKELVKKAVGKLSPKQRMVFILRDLEGLEIIEIVGIIGLSSGRIKSNLYYARKKLRQILEQIYKT